MFCKQCGAELADNARFCAACGQTVTPDEAAPAVEQPATGNAAPPTPPQYTVAPPPPAPYPPYEAPKPLAPNDSTSFGWAVLGFFYPLAGLILYCIWRLERPQCAKRIGLGALVRAILSVIGGLLWGIFVIGLLGNIMTEFNDVFEYDYYARMLLSFIS